MQWQYIADRLSAIINVKYEQLNFFLCEMPPSCDGNRTTRRHTNSRSVKSPTGQLAD